MTKQEFAIIAVGIKSAYPASKILEDEASMSFWYQMLQDIDGKVFENAVMEHVSTNIYPPNIAEIRRLCVLRMSRPLPTADEAWGTVRSAISSYGFYNPKAAFETMDDITRDIVKNLGWNNLCMSENPTADRANFRMAYEARIADAQNNRLLPEFVEQKKLALQKHYYTPLEDKAPRQIEEKDTIPETRELTEEEIVQRRQMIEDVKRRIAGGN